MPILSPGAAITCRREGGKMATCETCGNDYDKAFQVVMNDKAHTFDSFECAIHALAPRCEHCGTRIVGHGMEKGWHLLLLRSLRSRRRCGRAARSRVKQQPLAGGHEAEAVRDHPPNLSRVEPG
jgi:hypothetical protein